MGTEAAETSRTKRTETKLAQHCEGVRCNPLQLNQQVSHQQAGKVSFNKFVGACRLALLAKLLREARTRSINYTRSPKHAVPSHNVKYGKCSKI